MNKELLTVPHIVAVLSVIVGVLDTSGVSSSDEVSNSALSSGTAVPHNFSGSSIIHRRRP